MLAIRLKRTGRSGHAQFRVIVQDSRFHPTRGRVVAYLGSYNPHSKTAQIDKELAKRYLSNGAQPSDRAAKLLKDEGIKLPDWVKVNAPKTQTIRNPEKLRRNRPEQPAGEAAPEAEAPEPAEAPAEPAGPAEEAVPEVSETPAEGPAAASEPETEEAPVEKTGA